MHSETPKWRGMGQTMVISHQLLSSNLTLTHLGINGEWNACWQKTWEHARVLWLLVPALTLKTNNVPCWIRPWLTPGDTWSTAHTRFEQAMAGTTPALAPESSVNGFSISYWSEPRGFLWSPWGKWNTSSCPAGSAPAWAQGLGTEIKGEQNWEQQPDSCAWVWWRRNTELMGACNSQINQAGGWSCFTKTPWWQEVIRFVKNNPFQRIFNKRIAGKTSKWLKQSLSISLRHIYNKTNSSQFPEEIFHLKFILCHNSTLVVKSLFTIHIESIVWYSHSQYKIWLFDIIFLEMTSLPVELYFWTLLNMFNIW